VGRLQFGSPVTLSPKPCRQRLASQDNPTSSKIRPSQYACLLRAEIDAYSKDRKGAYKGKALNMPRAGQICSHESWKWYMEDNGWCIDTSGPHLLALCDVVLGEVLPSWVVAPLGVKAPWGGLCKRMCEHGMKENILGPLGGKGQSLCFPYSCTQAHKSNGNNKHVYMYDGMGKKGGMAHPSYLRVVLGVQEHHGGKRVKKRVKHIVGVHELLCYVMWGAPLGKQEVNHTCSHKWCLNPHHLKWDTHSNNIIDYWGMSPRKKRKIEP
jgi:hypothetical protein